MYTVTVIRQDTGEAIAENAYVYGAWKEIGFWLDNYGYIDPDYRVVITFTDK